MRHEFICRGLGKNGVSGVWRTVRGVLFLLFVVLAGRDGASEPLVLRPLGFFGGGPGQPAPQVDGDLAAFAARETLGTPIQDFNGDGDRLDSVLHIYRANDDTTFNLAHAVSSFVLDSGIVAFVVPESAQGLIDLNLDGDASDGVLHVYDGTLTLNLRFAVDPASVRTNGKLVAFLVDETAQGLVDLNGDGDAVDFVLHVFDLTTASTCNLGLAVPQGAPLFLDGCRLAFAVSESGQTADLNGDGDSADLVQSLCEVGASSCTVTNLGLAVFSTGGVPGFLLNGDLLAFAASEQSQGGTDLNGDFDSGDAVVHLYDAAVPLLTNLGLAVTPSNPLPMALDGTLLACGISEMAQGMADRNANGAATDTVLFVYNNSTVSGFNTALATQASPQAWGGKVAFSVSEVAQGTLDFNADGDAMDDVVHVYDGATNVTTNLGLATQGGSPLQFRDDVVVFGVSEGSQGSTDLNGDGDSFDSVLYLRNTVTSTTTALALAEPTGLLHGISGDIVGVTISEVAQGTDLNSDGDNLDPIAHAVHVPSQVPINLGFPTNASLTAAVSDRLLIASDPNTTALNIARFSRTDFPFLGGSVNSGQGNVVKVLSVNNVTDVVYVKTGQPIQVNLTAAPFGPQINAGYVLWVWLGCPTNPFGLTLGSANLGGVVNPTPFQPFDAPQPFLCLNGGLPAAFCAGLGTGAAPGSAPWTVTKAGGFNNPAVFTLQAVLQDNGAANTARFSVTNAVVIQVVP